MNYPSTAGCTVVTRNHLSLARVLAASFCRWHPDSCFYVVVLDDTEQGSSRDTFTRVSLNTLNIPNIEAFTFQYDAFELACAVKAPLLAALISSGRHDKVLYLDADMLVLRP